MLPRRRLLRGLGLRARAALRGRRLGGSGLALDRLARRALALAGRRRRLLRLGSLRRRDPGRLDARQIRRLLLGPFRRDDDRVWQALGTALPSQDLIGLGAARPLGRDLQQLRLELILAELAALQPRARLDDLLDV